MRLLWNVILIIVFIAALIDAPYDPYGAVPLMVFVLVLHWIFRPKDKQQNITVNIVEREKE